jgi:hypothetical protein
VRGFATASNLFASNVGSRFDCDWINLEQVCVHKGYLEQRKFASDEILFRMGSFYTREGGSGNSDSKKSCLRERRSLKISGSVCESRSFLQHIDFFVLKKGKLGHYRQEGALSKAPFSFYDFGGL